MRLQLDSGLSRNRRLCWLQEGIRSLALSSLKSAEKEDYQNEGKAKETRETRHKKEQKNEDKSNTNGN